MKCIKSNHVYIFQEKNLHVARKKVPMIMLLDRVIGNPYVIGRKRESEVIGVGHMQENVRVPLHSL